ncbi:hypothetical protein GOBAR_DD11615 [Gossypium barbadense]|nr:hypothetical protein GOBAR_DD11615 [Gossypium barbadense]
MSGASANNVVANEGTVVDSSVPNSNIRSSLGSDSGVFVQNGEDQVVAPYQKSQRVFYGQGSHGGQNRYASQNVCAGMQNRSLARGPHVSNAQHYAYKPNLCKFGHDEGQGYNGDTSHGFTTGNGQWQGYNGNKSHGPNIQHSSHGPHVQFNAGPNIVPSSNFVQVDQYDPGSPEPIGDGLGIGGPVLRFTKPRAQAYTGQTSSTVVPLVWPSYSSNLEPCMMTPSLQGLQSQSTDPVLDVNLEHPQSHDSSADVGTGSGNLPAVHGSGSSSDTNAHSHSTMRMSTGVSSASDIYIQLLDRRLIMERGFLDKEEDNAAVRTWSKTTQEEKGDSLADGHVLDVWDFTHISVDKCLFQALAQFWNHAYSCFTFGKSGKCAKSVTGMSEQWVVARIKQKGDSKCVPWRGLKDAILTHPDVRKMLDVFALSIYGLVVFPKALGYVDEAVTDIFDRLDKKVTPIPAILAETFSSLSAYRKTGEGRFIGCAQLLLAWFHSHFWKVDKVSYRVFSKNYSPLKEIVVTPRRDDISKEKWMAILQNLREEDIEWRAHWLLPDEILYRCGSFRTRMMVIERRFNRWLVRGNKLAE